MTGGAEVVPKDFLEVGIVFDDENRCHLFWSVWLAGREFQSPVNVAEFVRKVTMAASGAKK